MPDCRVNYDAIMARRLTNYGRMKADGKSCMSCTGFDLAKSSWRCKECQKDLFMRKYQSRNLKSGGENA